MVKIRLLLWPIEFLIKLIGRLAVIIIGLVVLIIGGALTFTVVGAVIGIPLAIFGILLIVRGLF